MRASASKKNGIYDPGFNLPLAKLCFYLWQNFAFVIGKTLLLS
jgi:hypothetical protein